MDYDAAAAERVGGGGGANQSFASDDDDGDDSAELADFLDDAGGMFDDDGDGEGDGDGGEGRDDDGDGGGSDEDGGSDSDSNLDSDDDEGGASSDDDDDDGGGGAFRRDDDEEGDGDESIDDGSDGDNDDDDDNRRNSAAAAAVLDEESFRRLKRDDPDLTSLEVRNLSRALSGEEGGRSRAALAEAVHESIGDPLADLTSEPKTSTVGKDTEPAEQQASTAAKEDEAGAKGVGHYIGRSSHLKTLSVMGESIEWEEDFLRRIHEFRTFCDGIADNRSLERLLLRDCYLTDGGALTDTRFVRFCVLNDNLRSLELVRCDLGDVGTVLLARALKLRRNKSSVRRINLYANEIGDGAGLRLVRSLEGYDGLSQFSLGKNHVASWTCRALEELLAGGPPSRPRLLAGPASNLKELILERNWIDDAALCVLARGLASNATLEDLDLKRNSLVTPVGWTTFASCFGNPNIALERLDLTDNCLADVGMMALGGALTRNTSLRVLDLSRRRLSGEPLTISAVGWTSFFDGLRNSSAPVDEIHLRGHGIDDERLGAITNALAADASGIKILDLSDNPRTTREGWRRFFDACLRPPASSLEGLFLCENDLTDDVVRDLASSLRGNAKVEAVDLGENPDITKAGWSAFARLLCDDADVDAASSSNHSIEYLGPQRLPADLARLIRLNKRSDKREVARTKVLRHALRRGTRGVDRLLAMDRKVLPRAFAWLARESRRTRRKGRGGEEEEEEGRAGRAVLYEVLRGRPSLLFRGGDGEEASGESSAGSKRRRSESQSGLGRRAPLTPVRL